jgi:hypothetical protein
MKTALLTIAAVLLLLTSSCGNYVYKRTSIRTPLLKEKNDVNIQLNGSNAGTEIYAAFAPLNNLAFSGGYTWRKDTFASIQRAIHDMEFSVIPFFAKKSLRIEMPMGVGFFQQRFIPSNDISQPYSRIFFQPTVGASWDIFDIAWINRISLIEYANPAYQADTRFESGVMFRAGFPVAKAMMQFTFDNGTNNSGLVDYYNFHVSLGLSFAFNAGNLGNKKTTAPDTTTRM